MTVSLEATERKAFFCLMDNMAYGLWPMETLRARLIAPEIPNNLPISNLKEDELMYPMRPEPEPVMAEFKFQEYGWWRDEDGKLQCGTMPRREWQGLTDEEIRNEAKNHVFDESFFSGAIWARGQIMGKNNE
jgi:hypothetical protein